MSDVSTWRSEKALLAFALGAIRRRRGRSVSLFVSLTGVSFLIATLLLLTSALRAEYTAGASGMPDLTVQRLVGGRPSSILSRFSAEIAEFPAVRAVTPRVWGYAYLPSAEGNVVIVGAGHVSRNDIQTIAGTDRPPRTGEAVLGEAVADRVGVLVGDRLAFPTPGEPLVLSVIGTFKSESALRTADVVLVDDGDARTLLGVPEGEATDLAIDLTTPDESDVITRRVLDRIPFARVLDKRSVARTYELTFGARSGALGAFMLPLLAALLLLAWDRWTGVGESERREIGVLKALGWETRHVLRARMWEAGLLSCFGALWGAMLAYVFVFVLRAPLLSDALLGWSTLAPPFDLAPVVSLDDLAFLWGIVVVPFVAASVVPAWRVAVIDPDRAMRGTP